MVIKEKTDFPWTAVVVSAKSSADAVAIEKELVGYQLKGIIPESTVILTISDPHSHKKRYVGSGGATINALLYAVEQLSARRNYQVLTPDVLYGSKILVILHGRPYPFGGSSRAFTALPTDLYYSETHVELNTVLLQLYNFVSTKVAANFPDGLWICSSDMLIEFDHHEVLSERPSSPDACVITVSSSVEYAANHGVAHRTADHFVKDIVYMGSESQLKPLREPDGSVALVSGIVYLSVAVGESLLALQNTPLFESCTYLSDDVGTEPYAISLFFDILLAMCNGVTDLDFLNRGNYIKQPDPRNAGDSKTATEMAAVRKVIWRNMRRFKLTSAHFSHARHNYLTVELCAAEHLKSLPVKEKITHSVVLARGQPDLSLAINSLIHEDSVAHSKETVVINSVLGAEARLQTENFVCNVDTAVILTRGHDLVLKKGLGWHSVLSIVNGVVMRVPTVFGLNDRLMSPYEDPTSSYCNEAWETFLAHTGIKETDLWPDQTMKRSAWTAKLFPAPSSQTFPTEPDPTHLFWAFEPLVKPKNPRVDHGPLERWRSLVRFSLEDIISNADLASELKWRRTVFYEVFCRKLEVMLLGSADFYFLPFFRSAEVDGFSTRILQLLDEIASKASIGIVARAYALIADMLGCMARGRGGLRSGPAANEAFLTGFHALESGNASHATRLLAEERSKWLARPDLLIRCARHYEAAAQICIRQAVATAIQFIQLKTAVAPSVTNVWFLTECPARIDLSGGWSDTPPIAYEKGGLVVNAALLIDGKRPVGARARKILENLIRILGGPGEPSLDLRSISDVKDYCNPSSPGALVKCCLLFTKIIELSDERDLPQQLAAKWNCGMEIEIWSRLPQGSGLGTSSILAGAIIATFWNCIGQGFNNLDLVHAVLCVEQMLTTGGGWQDQVGGVYGGFKAAASNPTLPLQVSVEPLPITNMELEQLNQRIMLIYTGKPRLAKNLLQNVIRNWYARESETVTVFEDLIVNAHKCMKGFQRGILDEVFHCMSTYYTQKKRIAPGTEPAYITRIIAELEPMLTTWVLAGAGGGGFLFCVLKDAEDRTRVRRGVESLKEAQGASFYHATIDAQGIQMNMIPY